MANVNFKYTYPYFYFNDKAKYGMHSSTDRITINGNYVYPWVFNTTVPGCTHIELDLEVTNTGSGSVFGSSWEFQVYRKNYGWYVAKSFTLPSDGKYNLNIDISNYTITQFILCPAYRQSSSTTWTNSLTLKKLCITESIELSDLTAGMFQYGIFPNYYGVETGLTEVHINVDGVLKQATGIFVNIGDELKSLQPVQSAYMKTSSETMKLYKFIPTETGQYRIKVKRLSGDHEIRLYDSDYSPLYDGYFYDRSFELTQGSVYYITLTHYYSNTDTGESYLQIYKED